MDNSALGFFVIMLLVDWLVAAVRASLGHARLTHLMDLRESQPAADATIRLLEGPRLRLSLRVGVILVHFLLAGALWLLLDAVIPLLSMAWLAALILLVAGLLVMSIEYFIEGRIARNPETWAMRLLGLARLLDALLGPLAGLMELIRGVDAQEHHLSGMTEDELKSWVEEDSPEGGLEQGERQMIYSIFQFGDTLCREIMVPRIDVFALDVEVSLTEAIEALVRSGHSRVPVYAESIDNVVGILYAKDLLRLKLGEVKGSPIRGLCRPAYFVPEAKKVDELLREMKSRRVHMAVVVDEYGGMAGIVTLEDIVEEIVGEIRDEYDLADEALYQRTGPDEVVFQGRIDLDDFNEVLGTHLAKEFADTLAGYVYGEIGKVPAGGEQLTVDDWVLTVEQVSGRRIRKVVARRSQPQPEPEEKGEDNRDQRTENREQGTDL